MSVNTCTYLYNIQFYSAAIQTQKCTTINLKSKYLLIQTILKSVETCLNYTETLTY